MMPLTPMLLLVLLAVACGGAGSPEPPDGTAEARTASGGGGAPDEHAHRGHEDEALVLTAEQTEAAGITTLRAGPGHLETTLTLAAVVSPNLDTQAHVTPRVAGLVHAVHVGLGEEVTAGDALCEIDSAEFGRLVSAYVTAVATVQMDEGILAGERLILERNVELAQEVFDREEDLADQGIATVSARYQAQSRLQDARLRRDSRILELEARLARDRIQLVAAERELEILGVPHEALEEIAAAAGEPHASLGRYTIRAPRGGVIVMRDVSDAEHVDTETTIFRIQDLSTVWVMGSVYEQDLASVRVGAPAIVTLDAHPDLSFDGVVAFIDTTISPTTRAASVRIELENVPLDSWPEAYPIRPGMFGVVEVTTGQVEASVVVPEAALVHDEPFGDFVFVETEPGVFEQRHVHIGARTPTRVEVVSGLEPGETIASSGTFLLKSAARADELGEGHEH